MLLDCCFFFVFNVGYIVGFVNVCFSIIVWCWVKGVMGLEYIVFNVEFCGCLLVGVYYVVVLLDECSVVLDGVKCDGILVLVVGVFCCEVCVV